VTEGVRPLTQSSPYGLDPATIRSVYKFPTSLSAGSGTTIAIVDAFDDPTAEADLNVFSQQYGLPACTSGNAGNGCFTKVNQSGGTSYPRSDGGWALEISLDIQWAHAIAPGAKILLVEANDNSFNSLATASNYAKAHAQYVSYSFGGGESQLATVFYKGAFSPPTGVSAFASSGDSGKGCIIPACWNTLISVGGTTLNFDTGGNFAGESAWSGGGGGCSASERANTAQSSFAQYGQVKCGGKRASPDVALDADPASGVSVYDSTCYQTTDPATGQPACAQTLGGNWFKVGGTSASSPMWAARSAARSGVSLPAVNAAYVYGTNIGYRDITTGSNGNPCLAGYDLCAGRGSWVSQTP
jgi:subtilase family serine protease